MAVTQTEKEQMNVVIVGHVDHGKSTLIGRLLADTGSLPEGKLEAVKANCAKNAKPFEFAFLLDALKDEQSQGITIDTARSFFKSEKRDYIIIDAPGHIEFLKNMVTGAARAEAGLLVIDAKEGIRENSKRHGYMLSFLGIKNITVCVNKMDLVKYDQWTFGTIRDEYTKFLHEINIKPMNFIPISAREGDNIASLSERMPWYKGLTILDALDHFKKAAPTDLQPVRFPVQDIYKFTEQGDDRRIIAGRVESGTVHVGDDVIFYPSNKKSRIASIESFHAAQTNEAVAGESAGFTLDTQIYIRPGELMAKVGEKHPHVSTKFKANIFWMGKQPLIKGKTYKLKIATQQIPVILSDILGVLDASELSSIGNKNQVDRHDVAECVLETLKPVAFDEVLQVPQSGRFVIVDNYEIAGGGIILAPIFEQDTALKKHVREREFGWERSDITYSKRTQRNKHKAALVIMTGSGDSKNKSLAKGLEEELFKEGCQTYFLGMSAEILGEGQLSNDKTLNKIQYLRQLGETAHMMTDAGLILIASIGELDEYDLTMLKSLNSPHKTIVVSIGDVAFGREHADVSVDPGAPISEALSVIIKAVRVETAPDEEFTI